MSNLAVAANLRAAADVIRREGWAQYDYQNESGGYCVVGAINRVAGIGPMSNAIVPYKIAFKRATGCCPVTFNDATGRTASEVLTALETAAVIAETEEIAP